MAYPDDFKSAAFDAATGTRSSHPDAHNLDKLAADIATLVAGIDSKINELESRLHSGRAVDCTQDAFGLLTNLLGEVQSAVALEKRAWEERE
jgi:hypothetical protein